MTEPTTLGGYLRSARRRRRVSIERAAEETRIRADFLMRMESDEFDFLAAAYVRGFLRSYAHFLRVPVEPLVDEFDRIVGRDRIDPRQIAAIERRARQNTPREPRLKNNWALAAVIAAVAIVGLAFIGLVTNPDDRPRRDVALSTSPTSTPTPTPTPTSEEEPPAEDAFALNDGIEVTIEAVDGECWVDVTADGENIYTSQPSLAEGELAGPFNAEKSMTIILGNAGAVELVINGQRFGPIGDDGEVVTLKLPDDADSLS